MNTFQSLTVIVPAFNEEANITGAVDSVLKSVEGWCPDYEIIVCNDGSKDRTGSIVEELARKNPRIRIVHNDGNKGYGYCYQRGVKLATKDFVAPFPGDNDMAWQSFKGIVQRMGEADIVTSYMINPHKRSLFRVILSKTFVVIMRTLFGVHLRYFNGMFICRRELLQSIAIRSTGLSVLAESQIKLIRNGASYIEVPFEHTGREGGSSKAFGIKNVVAVVKSIFTLWRDVYGSPQPSSRPASQKI